MIKKERKKEVEKRDGKKEREKERNKNERRERRRTAMDIQYKRERATSSGTSVSVASLVVFVLFLSLPPERQETEARSCKRLAHFVTRPFITTCREQKKSKEQKTR